MAVKREDLSCLEKFDADSVLEVLRSRYANDEIYVSTDKKKHSIFFKVKLFTEPIFKNTHYKKSSS